MFKQLINLAIVNHNVMKIQYPIILPIYFIFILAKKEINTQKSIVPARQLQENVSPFQQTCQLWYGLFQLSLVSLRTDPESEFQIKKRKEKKKNNDELQ